MRCFIFTRIRVSNARTLITFPPRVSTCLRRSDDTGRHSTEKLTEEEKEKEEGRMKKSDEASRAGERKKQKEKERKREKDRTCRCRCLGLRLDKISRERLPVSSVFRFLLLFALTRRVRRVITSSCKYFLIKPSRVASAFSARVIGPPDSAERSLSIDISDITCGDIATRSLMAFRGPPSLPASSASWYATE